LRERIHPSAIDGLSALHCRLQITT
jgi:hypothetical protein